MYSEVFMDSSSSLSVNEYCEEHKLLCYESLNSLVKKQPSDLPTRNLYHLTGQCVHHGAFQSCSVLSDS